MSTVSYLRGLAVTNACLRQLGETELASEEESHPLSGDAKAIREQVLESSQARGWWYNIEYPTLSPEVTGIISVPNDTLSVMSDDLRFRVAQRGRKLWDQTNSTDSFTVPIKVRLIRKVELDDLPLTAFDYVLEETVRRFLSGLDADNAKIAGAEGRAKAAYAQMHSEHIRAFAANAADANPTIQRIRSLRGWAAGGVR